MPLKNIAILGASGNLGPAILRALQSEPTFTITVLRRASSRASFPSSVRVLNLPESSSSSEFEEKLVAVLGGIDALIITLPPDQLDVAQMYGRAAAKAGVKRVIPPDFGSVDSSDERCVELVPSFYLTKKAMRETLQKLAAEDETFSWTTLINGHFFDHGFESGLLGFYPRENYVEMFDDGNLKWSASTLERIAEATVQILLHEEETRNKIVYAQSFCVSQNTVKEAWEKVTGKALEVRHVNSEEYIERKKKEMAEGKDFREARESMVKVLGLTRTNWEEKENFINERFELKSQSLDEALRQIHKSLEDGH